MLLALRKLTVPGLIVVGVVLQFSRFLRSIITYLILLHFRKCLEKFNSLLMVTPRLS